MKFKTPFFVLEIEPLFVIIIFVTILSNNFRSYISNYFICYLFILFHELSHMFVASILGKEIEKFKFSISGVNIMFKRCNYNMYKSSLFREILVYLAGPCSNIILAILFKNNVIIFQINLFLAFINLLPIYPLDGYNILKNILYFFFNIKKSRLILDFLSKVLFVLLMIIAIFQVLIIRNPSILIFVIYVYIINKSSQKDIKYNELLTPIIC